MDTLVTECFERFHAAVNIESAVGDPSPEVLGAKIAAFESFQKAIHDKMTAEIIQLKRHHNRTSLIHRLPNELLTKVLLKSVDLFDWKFDEIKSIALVSTLWFDIVHANHAFWPEICLQYPLKVIDIITKRNQSGPLRVRCEKGDAYPGVWRLEKFMAVAVQHAHRWESLLFHGPINATLQEYLFAPAPLLRDILIDQYSEGGFAGIMTLPEGAPLRHLDLDYIVMTWDTPRFSGLKTIQLRNLFRGLPSVSHLHTILSASPELEWLSLVQLKSDADGPHVPEAWAHPLHLSHLSTLHIQDIPEHLSQYLLSTIDAPACHSFIALGLQEGPLQPGQVGLQFHHTLSAAIQSSDSARVIYDFDDDSLTLRSKPLPQIVNDWAPYLETSVGFEIRIPRPPEENAWEQAANLLSSVSIPSVPTSFKVGLLPEVGPHSKLPDASQLYRQLVVPWRSAVSLAICDDLFLRCLAEQHPNDDSYFEWLCPKLRVLRISRPSWVRPEVLAKRVVAFAKQRYGAENGELDVISGPEPLGRLEIPAAVASLIRRERVFRDVDVVKLEDLMDDDD